MAETLKINSLISSLSIKDSDAETITQHDLTPEQWENLFPALVLVALTDREVEALVPLAQEMVEEHRQGSAPFISLNQITSVGPWELWVLFAGSINWNARFICFKSFIGLRSVLGGKSMWVKGPGLCTKIEVGGHAGIDPVPLPGELKVDIWVEERDANIYIGTRAVFYSRVHLKRFKIGRFPEKGTK
ncbi:hypothetical protein ONZ45_g11564 [Pleurotus djamor]|nr:hypothetical protein ONZ45_g11564 [Pleurotus djamor]